MRPLSQSTPPVPPIPRFDAETARRFLAHLLDTEAGALEICVLKGHYDRGGYIVKSERYSGSTIAGWYDNLHDALVDLPKARGISVYAVVNPTIQAMLSRTRNRLAKQDGRTHDSQIAVFRRWLIDLDARRPDKGISATDEELAATVEVRDQILRDHPALAAASIWGKSGNGSFILPLLPDYAIEEGKELVVKATAWLAARYSSDRVEFDTHTTNAARLGPIPGTAKCKGEHNAERPHRLATLDSNKDPVDVEALDLRAWIAAVGADRMQAAQPARGSRKAKGHANGQAHEANGDGAAMATRTARGSRTDDRSRRIYRAERYLTTKDPAISGQNGHRTAFNVARDLVIGFGLTFDEAWPLYGVYSDRCVPPWSDREKIHKLQSAIDEGPTAEYPLDYLYSVAESQSPDGANGHAETNGHVNGKVVGVPGGSPVVEVHPEEIVVNSQVCGLLKNHDGLYQRNYRLVEVVKLPKDEARRRIGVLRSGTPMMVMIQGPRLREIISGVATFRCNGKPAFTPETCVSALMHRGYWPGLPILAGVVEHPVMRPDGSMKEGGGYDEETGILCASDEEFLPVPENPTRDDAAEAAGRLAELVEEFPFQGRPHLGAWLACLLTILNRHLIDDAVPLFLVEATLSGTGKTLLCDLISRILTGRDMVRGSYYHDAIEMDKRITSIALEGQRVTMLDNVEGSFGNSALDNALTGRWYQGRVLGQTAMTAPLLLDSVFIATGNNINFCGDVFRRIVLCRLESPHERPDRDKTDFKIADIRAHVIARRRELLRDALTITRAYLQAGQPCTLPLNVYGAWTKLIRGMIVWCTGIDPLETQMDLAEADVVRVSRAAFIDGFAEMLEHLNAYQMSAGDILNHLGESMYTDRFSMLREAISGLTSRPGLPSVGSLGKKIMSMRGARSGNLRLVKTGKNKHTALWGVQQFNEETQDWEIDSRVEHIDATPF